jgi:inhibitor of KinA
MLPDAAYTIYPLGDEGLTIELGDRIAPAVNQRCLLLAEHLRKTAIPGVRDIVAAYASVSLLYDAAKIRSIKNVPSAFHFIESEARNALTGCRWNDAAPGRKMEIPMCYDVSLAPDLAELAGEKNISTDEVVRIHSSHTYRVYMLGFIPGFAYMGTVDVAIAMPRRAQPRLNVAAGSIGIAGSQTGIYPLESPGGWNIIGRTPLRIFSATSDEPCLLRAGDEVTFLPVTLERFHQLNEHT